MKAFRTLALVLIFFAGSAGFAAAESVGFGLTVSGDFPEVPDEDEIYSALLGNGIVDPGFLFYFQDREWGLSFDFGFDFTTTDPDPDDSSRWFMDFDFTMTYDWHLFGAFVIDPILQIGGGMNLETEIVEEYEEPEYVRLGFHPVLGAGVNLNLGHVFARGVMQFQGIPIDIPSPDVQPIEIAPVRVLLSAGIRLE